MSCILAVTSSKAAQKRMMLQMGVAGSDTSRITYLGASSEDVPKATPKSDDFQFNPGDELLLTGFVTDLLGEMDYGILEDAPCGDKRGF